jgi:hypothetical protein
MILHANLTFSRNVNRQYNSDFANSGATMSGKIGPSLRVRKPNRYTVRTGAAIQVQDTAEDYVTIYCTTQKGVDMRFSSADLTLTIDEFSDRYIKPAALLLASQIDYDGLALANNIYNYVGAPSSNFTISTGGNPAPGVFLNAGAQMSLYNAPIDERAIVLSPYGHADSVSSLSGLFNPQETISEQFHKGEMGSALGFDFHMDQNIQRLTPGTRVATGSVTINAPSQTGSSITFAATTGATFAVGDLFYFSSGTAVNTVNPETKQDSGVAQQFVVTAAATAASSTVTLSISPSIITSGATQTVTASPDNGATVTFIGAASTAYTNHLAFHKDAFTLVTADLLLPKGVDFASREVYDGISARIIRQYDINNDNLPCRLDVLYGWTTIRPELACRILAAR